MADLTNLPIFKSFDQIEKGLDEAKNLILKSPTGSGKSLGLPILLFQKKIPHEAGEVWYFFKSLGR